MLLRKDDIVVIGHKNPDTDSICSAISYAYLKNRMTGTDRYIAARAGDINGESAYVLERFGAKAPVYIDDITMRIGDLDYDHVQGIERTASLKEAWEQMRRQEAETLPVVRHDRLEGIITMENIALSSMETIDPYKLAEAHTKFGAMADATGGTILTGNPDAYFLNGKVVIASGGADFLRDHIRPGDLVVTGNRREILECALEEGAACIVMCTLRAVDDEWIRRAREAGCVLILAENDTYSVTKMLEQSMPVSYFMERENVTTFRTAQLCGDVRTEMAKHRHRSFPVLDGKGRYMGMIGRRHLIHERKRGVILVDHQETTQAVDGLEHAEILEMVDHHKIGNIQTVGPIYFRNQPLGCTATIIYEIFEEEGIEIPPQIAGLMVSAILSDTLLFRSPTCTKKDEAIARKLAQIADIDPEEHAMAMFKAGSDFAARSIDEIFFGDFKKFQSGGVTFGIGQVNIMSDEEGAALKERVVAFLKESGPSHGYDMVFFMMTNILTEVSEVIFAGEDARRIVEEAFGTESDGTSVILPGVLSRKKQMLPPLMNVMRQNV